MNDQIGANSKSGLSYQADKSRDDPYWWEASSSKNLMESNDGLWDGLFQEKDPIADQSADNYNVFMQEKEPDCASENSKSKATNIELVEEQMESLSVSASTSISVPCSSQNPKPSSSRITENSDRSIRESSNSIGSHAVSDVTVHLDYARLKTEHRKLKKYFENAYESRYKTPPIKETIRRLNKNETIPLDFYRSHSEKMELLEAALEDCDWDGIVTILLFIKRTLSNPLFRQCLIERPRAAQHYVTYLRETQDTTELMDTLFGLGQTAEAAMVEFAAASKWTDPKRQLEALRNCLLSGFSHPQLANERRHLEEWITLLETHILHFGAFWR